MDYKEFLRNWGEKKKVTLAVACGMCGMPIEDDFAICAVPQLGRVCSRCYRGINIEATFLSRMIKERVEKI
jgi:hypothetical protein